ncbi:MAG: flagellar motor protein MotB, partial [Halobacteriovoraceae bacterium]|nr:flagellar motor protein MotB [Halobacteriovoraceae bacterium]
ANNEKNQAYMIESGLTIYQNDWGRGELQAYFRDREKGFSAPGQLTRYDTQQVGGKLKLPIGIARIDLSHDYKKEDQWRQKEVSSADLGFKLGKSWNVEAGIQHDKNKDLSSGIATTSLVSDFGSRLDSALEIKFVPGDEYDFYVFGQKTLNHDDSRLENDRFGIGGHYRFSNRFKLGGEFSDGDGGLGAKVRSDIAVDDRSDLYFTYQLDNRRTDNGFGERSGRQGIFVSGAKRRFGDSSNIYYEGRMDRSDYANSGLTHLFGVDLVPNNKWTVGLTIEKGDLESSDGLQKIERRAASVNLGYAGQNSKAGIALEAREETSSGNERTTYLVKSKLSSKLTQEWRFQLKLDLARSKTTQGDFYDGDWTDGSLGLAYRPINHDKWNFLFRYGYLEVLPSAGQVTSNGQIPEFKQRTHVLSADVIYDLNKYLSLGAKYGYRKGELQNNRVGGEWFENDAHLGIIRLDWHVIYQWDVLLEYRRLWQLDASQVRHGALVGIYRHLSKKKTLKIGVGYNFADFSDDLADPYYRYDGWFVNLVGGF